MILFEHIIGTLAPHLCVQCGREGAVLCDVCADELPLPPQGCYRCGRSGGRGVCATCQAAGPLHELYAATCYNGAAKKALRMLKFERASAAAQPLARSVSRALKQPQYDMVLPVPTANYRARQRGYDQAALIARHLALIQHRPYTHLLMRLGKQRQLGQNGTVRRTQLEGAFVVRMPTRVQNKHILIVDDVLTTGSTLEAAARVLLAAGASQVSAAVFAVVPRSGSLDNVS